VFAALDPGQSALTRRIAICIEKTAYPGHIAGIGIITRRRRDTCFTKGELWDEAGNLLATAQGSYAIVTLPAKQ
jgi:acyl-coenzyme A thioesterase PaaI-like protein